MRLFQFGFGEQTQNVVAVQNSLNALVVGVEHAHVALHLLCGAHLHILSEHRHHVFLHCRITFHAVVAGVEPRFLCCPLYGIGKRAKLVD